MTIPPLPTDTAQQARRLPDGPGGFIVEYTITRTELLAANSAQAAIDTVTMGLNAREIVKVVPLAHCSRCGAFGDVNKKRRQHRYGYCRGRWNVPAGGDTA